jgi:hypothetical protein
MIDFTIALLDWIIDIEIYHPRKTYFFLGVLVGIIIKYGG